MPVVGADHSSVGVQQAIATAGLKPPCPQAARFTGNARYTSRVAPRHKHSGSHSAGDWRDNSNINTSAVIGIFCPTPKNTVAPTNAAAPMSTPGSRAFHAQAAKNAISPPSIIDGVIRPP